VEHRLSRRAAGVQPSVTLAVTSRAKALRAAGHDVVSLSAGEPDFDTPEHIKQAARDALAAGLTRYTPVDGLPELKQAVAAKLQQENGLAYADEQILVSCGCKHSIYNLMQAVLDPGDEVIVPAPYWVSYPAMVQLAGGLPISIYADASQDFRIQPEQLRRALTARTRMVLLNSPNNPTGACYRRAELEALGAVLEDFPQVVIVSDDIYEHVYWLDEPFANLANAVPGLAERSVVCNGVSKAYAMTGWRIGYAAGPAGIIAAMGRIQSQSTSNPTSIAQAAAVAALTGNQAGVAENCRVFQQRHDYLHGRLNAMPHVQCLPAQGTFYLFPDVSAAIERCRETEDDVAFAEYLVERAGVATVPGSAFGAEGHLRLSFATDMERLEDATGRLQRLLEAL